jgi:hypothetical protein
VISKLPFDCQSEARSSERNSSSRFFGYPFLGNAKKVFVFFGLRRKAPPDTNRTASVAPQENPHAFPGPSHSRRRVHFIL